jgi:uncharacterized protein YecE (DUF72 family)
LILIGTSGYSFPDWVGPFYPMGIDRSRMLDYYARQFTAVEVNTTYYRIPPPSTMHSMERRTPPGFEFVVKANQEMTHAQSLDPELYRSFHRALGPLRLAAKLSGVIAQFPYAFRRSESGEEFLREMHRRMEDVPLFVEFRHDSWVRNGAFEFLEAEGLGYVSVDEPDLPGLVPPIARATIPLSYVRFHGRNKANWWGSGEKAGGAGRIGGGAGGARASAGDRYDYLYSEAELKEWAEKIRDLSRKTQKTFVFFNNCHVGQAAAGAKLMRRLLELPEPALADLPGLL